jgi:hypothetical protein
MLPIRRRRKKRRLTDVPPQDVLHVLLRVPSLDDQSMTSVDRTGRTQLGEEEGDDVLVLTMHFLTDVRKVGEDGLLVALLEHLGRSDGVTSSVAVKFGVLRTEDSEGSGEELNRGRTGSR